MGGSPLARAKSSASGSPPAPVLPRSHSGLIAFADVLCVHRAGASLQACRAPRAAPPVCSEPCAGAAGLPRPGHAGPLLPLRRDWVTLSDSRSL